MRDTNAPLLRAVLLATLLTGCLGDASEGPRPDNNPRFDWFQYEGNDPVYKTALPGANEFVNPILAGFYPDPSITRVGDDYYLVNSTFAYFPGIPVHHSRDLVNWTQIGNVISRASQLNFDSLGISRGVFAPSISHNKGTYYVLNTCVDCGGNFLVTASNPAGPWSDPQWLTEIDGIDPSFFFDDDGRAYIMNNGPPIGKPQYDGHRAIWIQEYDLSTKKLTGARVMLVNGGVDFSRKPIWIEGPHILRKDGHYYLTAAEGGTAEGHSQVVLRSEKVFGPYRPYSGNPILTQRDLGAREYPITSAGHAELVQTPAGDWWSIFLATRPYEGDLYNTGRETFLLPVKWVDGWPVILDKGAKIPYVLPRPALSGGSAPAVPTHGNFTVRDEFADTTLAPYWYMIRTPRTAWHDLRGDSGWLKLTARNADIGKRQQPSFIGRRQQHINASATTMMRYLPKTDGDKAGLIAFQNNLYNLAVVVTRNGGKSFVQVEQRGGEDTLSGPTILASQEIFDHWNGSIYLRIDARGGKYDFYYATQKDNWLPLKVDADGTILSTKVSRGFVGATFGLYAYSPSN